MSFYRDDLNRIERQLNEMNKKLDQLLAKDVKLTPVVQDPDSGVVKGWNRGELNIVGAFGGAGVSKFKSLTQTAIDDVEDLISKPQLPYSHWGGTRHKYLPNYYNPIEVVINKEKRTVVALMKEGKKVVRIGKAKCHPDDSFIPEIGTVIAVRRLFELEIPEKYTGGENTW